MPAAEASGEPPVGKPPKEGGAVVVKRCVEGCPNLNSDLKFTKEGFLVHKKTGFFTITVRAPCDI